MSGGRALGVDVSWQRGDLRLEARLDVAPGEVVAVLGPNGAGKSSLVRAIAGLDDGPVGRIDVDGAPVLDERIDVAPARRRVAVVFQDHLLFPHLTALENVAFGPRSTGVDRATARRTAAEWLERAGVGDLGARRPEELSGGQAQRVAVARALAASPRVLLLDEPLAALDATTRHEVRRELRRVLDAHDGATLLVTHDPLDAHALADRAVVMDRGRIVQEGTLAELSARPRSSFVADLLGVNVVRGVMATVDTVVLTGAATGRLVVSPSPAGPSGGMSGGTPATGDVMAAIRPSSVALHRERPTGSVRNVWEATVVAVEPAGDRVRVHTVGAVPLVAEVTRAAVDELGLVRDAVVWTAVKATDVDVYPA